MGWNPEFLADLDCQLGDPPGMALRRFVLRGERDHQSANVRAEERLLLADELDPGQVTRERARGLSTHKVERNRDPDHRDTSKFEAVTGPPADAPWLVDHRSAKRDHQQTHPTDDQQV